jgi:hypothetical protein
MEYEVIKNRWTGAVMCGGLSLKVVVEKHKKWLNDEEGGERANLSAADLRAADLRAANLSAANLSDANLSDANLSDANLSAADLRAANLRAANLSAANLSAADLRAANLRAANLRAANLSDADLRAANLSAANLSAANLSDANLSDATGKPGLEGVPTIPNIHQKVYEAANCPGALDMSTWHRCETTHCRAGWVIALAGEAGAAMEYCIGTPAAAALIYLKSDPTLEKVPNFYDGNADALADMKRLAELEAAGVGK